MMTNYQARIIKAALEETGYTAWINPTPKGWYVTAYHGRRWFFTVSEFSVLKEAAELPAILP